LPVSTSDLGPYGRIVRPNGPVATKLYPATAPEEGLGRNAVLERLSPLFEASPRCVLSKAGEYSLPQLLPIPPEELEVVKWYYSLPANGSFALQRRHHGLKALFYNWSDAVGLARRHAKTVGRQVS
jgi:hypothetical protein